MRDAGGGSIVNMSSVSGTGGGIFGNAIAYHASKGAALTMSKNAAIRFAADGIRMNSVHPGFTATQTLMDAVGG